MLHVEHVKIKLTEDSESTTGSCTDGETTVHFRIWQISNERQTNFAFVIAANAESKCNQQTSLSLHICCIADSQHEALTNFCVPFVAFAAAAKSRRCS